MATKRGEKSKQELVALSIRRKEDEYIERLVLPTDTLQGIALLYNTSVAELKKLNNLHKDTDLHARRILKVPSRGILVDLTEAPPHPPSQKPSKLRPDNTRNNGEDYLNGDDDEESTNGEVYLNNVDTALQEIREKAEQAVANSVVLQTCDSDESLTRKDLLDRRSNNEDVAWWKIALPCIGVLLILPYLYYLYLEHLEYIHHLHTAKNATNTTTTTNNVVNNTAHINSQSLLHDHI